MANAGLQASVRIDDVDVRPGYLWEQFLLPPEELAARKQDVLLGSNMTEAGLGSQDPALFTNAGKVELPPLLL